MTILSIATTLVSSPLLAQSISHSGDKTNFTEESTMSHEVIQKPAILVIGIDCRTSKIAMVLGSGVPLFSATNQEHQCHLISTQSYPSGLVQLKYEVIRSNKEKTE
ncbi:MAG: hypothetical protein JSR85_08330 [Proteobacteria bacterium]|nr:hypothetical protein [Pseudomonadota bacterium]